MGGQCGLDKRDRNKIEECIPFNSGTLLNYASVNSSSVHPPPGNPGAFPNVARPGGGAFAYLGLTPGHLTRGFETVE